MNGYINYSFLLIEKLKLLKWIGYIFVKQNEYTSKYNG